MESLNEIKRIQELMGIKTLINEQYVKLWSIYKYGDDLIKGGDELKSTIDKLSGKLSSTEKTILKNNDEINRILRKANSDLTAAETRFIQTAEKALTKLSQQEIGVFRRNVIGNLISKDPQYVKMNQGIINRIENFVAMRKPTEEFLPSGEQKFENYTVEEIEKEYKSRCIQFLRQLGKSEEVSEEVAEIMLERYIKSAKYKELVQDGIRIDRILPGSLTDATTKNYINFKGTEPELSRLKSSVQSELKSSVGLSLKNISTLRKFFNSFEFTRKLGSVLEGIFSGKLLDDYIETSQRLIIGLIDEAASNPGRLLDDTGKIKIDSYRNELKSSMEGMLQNNPSFRFFNPLAEDASKIYNFEKIFNEIEVTMKQYADIYNKNNPNNQISAEDINKLIKELKEGGNGSIDNMIKDSKLINPGSIINAEARSQQWKYIRENWFKLPKYNIKNYPGFVNAARRYISETLSWLGRGRVTALLTYGVFRTPGMLLKNIIRYGKTPDKIALGLLKTYTELIFLKQIITPLYGVMLGLRDFVGEYLGYDFDVPEGETIIGTIWRNIYEQYADGAATGWSALVPFEKGIILDTILKFDPITNKDIIKSEILKKEARLNTELAEELKKDQKGYINRVAKKDLDFEASLDGLKDPYYYRRNGINKEEANLLLNNIAVEAKKVEGTYEKLKDAKKEELLKKLESGELKSDDAIDKPEFKKDNNSVGGLKYGIKDNSGNIYPIGTSASLNTKFSKSNEKIRTVYFQDSDGSIKPIKEFLPKLIGTKNIKEQLKDKSETKPTQVPTNQLVKPKTVIQRNKQTPPDESGNLNLDHYMKNLIKRIVLQEEEEKTLKMKDWDEIFTFQKIDDKNPGKYTDVKIKMDSVMDRMPHWRKKYNKQCEELENCDEDGEDDSFVRAVIDTHPDVVRILYTKGLANLTSSNDQEDLNEGLHSLLRVIREAKNVEVEVWSVYRHPSSPDKIWSLVKGDYKPKELSSMDMKMQQSPQNKIEKKKDSLDELKKKELDAIKTLSLDEKKGLQELPIKVRDKVKEKIKRGWTTEKPSEDLIDFFKLDNIDSVFNEKIKIYKLKPNTDFFKHLDKKTFDVNIKRGFCRSLYYVEKELDLSKEKLFKVEEILSKCENKFDGKYGQNYL